MERPVKDNGSSWDLYAAAAQHYGTGSVRQTSNINDVINALSRGKLIISSQRAGIFTKGNHLIVLYKISNNLIYVCDPNKSNAIDKQYNNRGFTPNEINASAKGYFIFEA